MSGRWWVKLSDAWGLELYLGNDGGLSLDDATAAYLRLRKLTQGEKEPEPDLLRDAVALPESSDDTQEPPTVGIAEPFIPCPMEPKKSYRKVAPGYEAHAKRIVKPWTAPAVALYADGAIPREVMRQVPEINYQQAIYVRNQYSMEIAELASIPHGQERFKFLQDRFGFGGMTVDVSVGARLEAKGVKRVQVCE